MIARIQTVSWSKFKCFGGLDKRVENNTTESAGHFTQLKYTCPSESNLKENGFNKKKKKRKKEKRKRTGVVLVLRS